MKLIGAVCIVIASFFLGYTRRSAKLKGEKIAFAFSGLFGDIADSIEYRSRELGEVLDVLCVAEKYAQLDFLVLSCRLRDEGKNVHDALCSGFTGSDCAAALTGDERAEALEVLRSLGCETDVMSVNRLRAAAERFAGFARARHEINKSRSGYYEVLYTLGGAAAAIVLL